MVIVLHSGSSGVNCQNCALWDTSLSLTVPVLLMENSKSNAGGNPAMDWHPMRGRNRLKYSY